MKRKKLITVFLGLSLLLSSLSFGGCVCQHQYDWTGDASTHVLHCLKCGDVQEESREAHKEELVEAKSASVIEDGNEMGKICSICQRILEGCKRIPATTPFKGKTFGELNYCEYLPTIKEGEKAPLVLFMHGMGERGTNNTAQLRNAITKVVKRRGDSPFMEAVVLAPQCPPWDLWSNADFSKGTYTLSNCAETDPLKQVIALVKEYTSYSYIDADRVYVIGLSMGGYATWELIARYPDVFAAAVPICGGGPIDQVDVLKEIPIYAFHGKLDTLVPYEGSEGMVNAIVNAGGEKILLKTYEKGYHNIWDDAITFEGDERIPALDEWLFSQKKQ